MSTIAVVITGLVCFLSGAASLVAVILCAANSKRKNPKKRKQTTPAASGQKKSFLSRFGTMNLILVIIGITLLTFTIVIIDLFKNYGTIPDTLVTCVFAVLGGECGVMGWIKTNKDKNRDRKVELEDRRYYEEKEKAAMNDGEHETEVM